MKNRFRKTAVLTVLCLLSTTVSGTAFWSSRVLAADEGSIYTVSAGSVPTVEPIHAETLSGVMIEIPLNAVDPDGDAVAFRLVDAPKKGTAVIETDVLLYTPAAGKTGIDKFSYCALDVLGNCSEPCDIKIKIKKNKSKLTYADMTGNPSHLAAVMLHEAGIMTGEKIGTSYFFHPNDFMTRSEFIALAVSAGGYPVSHTSKTDFVDDDSLSAWSKSYISTAASNGLVSGCQTESEAAAICGSRMITYDEAASILCNLITPHLDSPLPVSTPAEDTHWAASANAVLSAVDLLPNLIASSGSDPITRADACKMVYETYLIIK